MIPPLGADGHLPPGRFQCSLDEIYERFVADPQFVSSKTRLKRFEGLVHYLSAWSQVAETTGVRVLRSMWIAGSFTSDKIDPNDVDVSPIVDGPLADLLRNQPGVGGIKKLTRHRKRVVAKYGVETFPITWHPIEHPFASDIDMTGDEEAYLADRGMLDDWWQRCRVNGQDVPSLDSCATRRGYLEVTL